MIDQNVHQGYVTENLTRFLKARDWDPSKAHQMVCATLLLLNVFFFCSSLYVNVTLMYILESLDHVFSWLIV